MRLWSFVGCCHWLVVSAILLFVYWLLGFCSCSRLVAAVVWLGCRGCLVALVGHLVALAGRLVALAGRLVAITGLLVALAVIAMVISLPLGHFVAAVFSSCSRCAVECCCIVMVGGHLQLLCC